MITMISGRKYNFQIVSQREGLDYSFFIRAESKSSGKTSCINNLNAILSEFGIGMEDPKVADSTWMVNKEEAQYFSDTATQFLSDIAFLDYIERKLDEDRMLGEWENVSKQ
jgi:hypothetical protein